MYEHDEYEGTHGQNIKKAIITDKKTSYYNWACICRPIWIFHVHSTWKFYHGRKTPNQKTLRWRRESRQVIPGLELVWMSYILCRLDSKQMRRSVSFSTFSSKGRSAGLYRLAPDNIHVYHSIQDERHINNNNNNILESEAKNDVSILRGWFLRLTSQPNMDWFLQ